MCMCMTLCMYVHSPQLASPVLLGVMIPPHQLQLLQLHWLMMKKAVCSTRQGGSAHPARDKWLSPSAPPSKGQDGWSRWKENTSLPKEHCSLKWTKERERQREREREKCLLRHAKLNLRTRALWSTYPARVLHLHSYLQCK